MPITEAGGPTLIGEAKIFETVAAATIGLTCGMVLLPVTDMVEEGEGMGWVGNG